MPEPDDAESVEPVPESPATWENVVVGEAKKVLGHLIHDEEYAEEGDEQIDSAREARKEYQDEQDHAKHDQ
jgi:uncharacterized protein YjbJ (UPF0337 family)